MICYFFIWMIVALVCTFMLARTILEGKGWKKIGCIFWWILTADCVILLENMCFNAELTNSGAVCILIGLTYLVWLSINYILNGKDISNKFGILAIWLFLLVLFAFSASRINTELMYFFKLSIMFVLLLGIAVLKDMPIVAKILISIVLYLLMIIFDVVVTSGFLFASADQPVEAVYEVFQRIYCLSPIEARYKREELITAMVDFLICRIMDVILLGFLSSTFVEMCSNHPGKNK